MCILHILKKVFSIIKRNSFQSSFCHNKNIVLKHLTVKYIPFFVTLIAFLSIDYVFSCHERICLLKISFSCNNGNEINDLLNKNK